MQDAILRMKATVTFTGLSRSTIYEKINSHSKYFDPDFPKPLKLSARSIGWISRAN
jgi:prophage regulatory protein